MLAPVHLEDAMSTKQQAVEAVVKNSDQFRPDFARWLCDNFQIYEKFESHGRIMGAKRSRYSARTIVEFIRHHTALREKDSEFKITNNVIPDMARLFSMLNPQYADLFEFRSTHMRDGLTVAQMAKVS